jgi:hypothetical protein
VVIPLYRLGNPPFQLPSRFWFTRVALDTLGRFVQSHMPVVFLPSLTRIALA